MLVWVLTALHVIVAFILILVVLLQTGKRADLAGAFGGGGSQTAFGTRGAATLLSKATTGAAVVFMLTSIGLSILSSQGSGGGTILPADEASSAPVAIPGPGADLPPGPEDMLPPATENDGQAPAPATETGEQP